jgi:hypothetical protein
VNSGNKVTISRLFQLSNKKVKNQDKQTVWMAGFPFGEHGSCWHRVCTPVADIVGLSALLEYLHSVQFKQMDGSIEIKPRDRDKGQDTKRITKYDCSPMSASVPILS